MKLRKLVFAYVLLVGLPLLALVAVLAVGARIRAPHAALRHCGDSCVHAGGREHTTPPAGSGKLPSSWWCRGWLGICSRKIRQPHVVGEMLAGIMLGPSLFGWLAPHLSASLFPPSNLYFLNAISQLGLVLFHVPGGP